MVRRVKEEEGGVGKVAKKKKRDEGEGRTQGKARQGRAEGGGGVDRFFFFNWGVPRPGPHTVAQKY